MNRKSFSKLAKIKGARTSDGHLGSAAIKGTGASSFASPEHIPVGKGTNPNPRGPSRTRLGSACTNG